MEEAKRDRILVPVEMCNAHPKACTTAALYKGNDAKGLLQALEDRFLIVEKNAVQAEMTKFNSMIISMEFVEVFDEAEIVVRRS